MDYTIFVDGRTKCFADTLEQAVAKGKKYEDQGVVLIETPSGAISTLAELQQFIDKEALFLAEW